MKILVIAIPGMGNTLLAVPMLKALRKRFPKARIDLLVGLKSSLELLKNCPYINNIYIINKNFQKGFFRNFSVLKQLRKEHYDISITTFPAQQPHYNLLASYIRARKRITHNYGKNLVGLQNYRVQIKICHDVEQNLNLLNPLGIKKKGNSKLELWLNKEEKTSAINFIKKFSENKLIGIHPGTSIGRGMEEKRWALENFGEVADRLIKMEGARILVFLGPEDRDLEKIIKLVKNKNKITIVKDLDIRKVAAIIEKCMLFISNDSGLMHIAVASSVPTIGIFMATDYRRTRPYTKNSIALHNGETYTIFRQSIEKLAGLEHKEGKVGTVKVEELTEMAKKMLK
ncbi:MAG: glycosyltransferase family 9 protein [Nanoarchaeota archaeon]